MFIEFFYKLKEVGIPVSPTSFLTLHRAIAAGLVNSIDDLYTAARTTLVKSEKYFDLYDQVFAHIFAGMELPNIDELAIDLLARSMLHEWLKDPKALADALGIDKKKLNQMSPEELLEYFKQRLKDQEGRHDGGSKWIGTGGTSPVGHSGVHPGGLRVGGESRNKSAVKVANERRYKDYSVHGVLTKNSIGEALKRLRNLVPQGVKDQLNIDATIYQTLKNGGEIELVFDRGIVDRLKIILVIDNGGWSMEPHVDLVQTLFSYAKSQFKDLKTYFFHNTIYDLLWQDPARYKLPVRIKDFDKLDPDTRLIIVGDASMAPYELMSTDGSIYAFERSGRPSIEQLKFLSGYFNRSIWLNPIPAEHWPYTHSINVIQSIFPMFELSLDGLEKGVQHLMSR
ncbi:vWA domain-containing protein [Desulfocastanea catecholica]